MKKLIIITLLTLTQLFAITYDYNDLNRVKKATYQSGVTFTYSYDDAGNLLSVKSEGIENKEAATWDNANKGCLDRGMRLPTIDELRQEIHFNSSGRKIDDDKGLWSSTENPNIKDNYYYVYGNESSQWANTFKDDIHHYYCISSVKDTDKDGYPDTEDAFPNDPDEWLDTDSDGIGNNADPDDDNDGISDLDEIKYGFDPLDPSDANEDADGDGVSNADEIAAGTNPHDKTSYPPDLKDTAALLMILMERNRQLYQVDHSTSPIIKNLAATVNGSRTVNGSFYITHPGKHIKNLRVHYADNNSYKNARYVTIGVYSAIQSTGLKHFSFDAGAYAGKKVYYKVEAISPDGLKAKVVSKTIAIP